MRKELVELLDKFIKGATQRDLRLGIDKLRDRYEEVYLKGKELFER